MCLSWAIIYLFKNNLINVLPPAVEIGERTMHAYSLFL